MSVTPFFVLLRLESRALYYHCDDEANPQCENESALCGDCEFRVRAFPAFVHEREYESRPEHCVGEEESAAKCIEGLSANEGEETEERAECRRDCAVVNADFGFACVVNGLNGIILAVFEGFCNEYDSGAEEVDHKANRGDRSRNVVGNCCCDIRHNNISQILIGTL